jgi:hypothetical protein
MMGSFPLGSGQANDFGRSEGQEPVHQCDADLDFGSLGSDNQGQHRSANSVRLRFYQGLVAKSGCLCRFCLARRQRVWKTPVNIERDKKMTKLCIFPLAGFGD